LASGTVVGDVNARDNRAMSRVAAATGRTNCGARSRVTLTKEEIRRFRSQGFLVVDRPLVTGDDLVLVRRLIADLFRRFDTLPHDLAYDLGEVQHHDGPQQLPEINHAMRLEPRLADTVAFRQCRKLAAQLLAEPPHCVFDHTICKPPHSSSAAEWHQDLATATHLAGRDAVHMWLPLQDVSEANGCMHFIPDAPPRRLIPHEPRGPRAHALVATSVDASTAVACPIAAGMVTVHGLTTLHYTGPNNTSEPRLVWILHFHGRPAPSAARMRLSRVKQSVLNRAGRLRADG
jgi:hypothetical protein